MDEYLSEDLAFLYAKLSDHPLLLLEQEKRAQFEQLYHQELARFQTAISVRQDAAAKPAELIDAMTRLTMFFHDGHTNIELPYTSRDKCLHISCDWQRDRLLLLRDYEEIPAGSQITAIENIPIENIVDLMSERIPHENKYLVKSRLAAYPYKNYHLFSEINLKRLFHRENCEIAFLVDGKIQKKRCKLQNYNGFLQFKEDKDFLSYEIDQKTVTLHLDACIYNEAYKKTLNDLAEFCEKNKIKTFILDLSRNMGGSSAVIDEFIKYVDIDKFRRYEMIDYTSGIPKYITRRSDIVKNPTGRFHLPAKIYCKVSQHTFSSARTFAVTLKDNGIAKIVGSPTGGKPDSFGMPKRFRTPHTEISFRVSTCLFLRPDAGRDEEIALFPDRERL